MEKIYMPNASLLNASTRLNGESNEVEVRGMGSVHRYGGETLINEYVEYRFN